MDPFSVSSKKFYYRCLGSNYASDISLVELSNNEDVNQPAQDICSRSQIKAFEKGGKHA